MTFFIEEMDTLKLKGITERSCWWLLNGYLPSVLVIYANILSPKMPRLPVSIAGWAVSDPAGKWTACLRQE